jgi:hypothetical protein
MSTMHEEFARLSENPAHKIVVMTPVNPAGVVVKVLSIRDDYMVCDLSNIGERCIPFSAVVSWKDVTASEVHEHVSLIKANGDKP